MHQKIEISDAAMRAAIRRAVESLTPEEWVDTVDDALGRPFDRYEHKMQVPRKATITVFVHLDAKGNVTGFLSPGALTREQATAALAQMTSQGDA